VLVTVLLGNVSPLLLELLTVNRLAGPKRRTGHFSCCPVNCQTLTRWSGWTICVHARDNNHQLSGFLPPVGMCSATSAPVTSTDLVART